MTNILVSSNMKSDLDIIIPTPNHAQKKWRVQQKGKLKLKLHVFLDNFFFFFLIVKACKSSPCSIKRNNRMWKELNIVAGQLSYQYKIKVQVTKIKIKKPSFTQKEEKKQEWASLTMHQGIIVSPMLIYIESACQGQLESIGSSGDEAMSPSRQAPAQTSNSRMTIPVNILLFFVPSISSSRKLRIGYVWSENHPFQSRSILSQM